MSLDDGVQKRFNGEQETYQDDKKNGPYIISLGFFPPSTAFLCQAAKFKALKGHFSDNELCHLGLFVCSVPVEAQDQCPCILGILLLYLYQEKDEIT